MSVAAPLVLRSGDGARLRELTRSSAAPAGHVQRARMVLLAAEGLSNTEVGRRVGMTRQTVIAWRAAMRPAGSPRSRTCHGRVVPPQWTRRAWWWPRSTRHRRSWA